MIRHYFDDGSLKKTAKHVLCIRIAFSFPCVYFKVRQGLIAYAYADGYPADVLILGEDHLEHYFQLWCTRVDNYNELLRSANWLRVQHVHFTQASLS